MHKGHLGGCVVAIGAALALFAVTGGSVGGLGLLLAVLICPLTMGAAMWFLMGSPRRSSTPGGDGTREAPSLDATTGPR